MNGDDLLLSNCSLRLENKQDEQNYIILKQNNKNKYFTPIIQLLMVIVILIGVVDNYFQIGVKWIINLNFFILFCIILITITFHSTKSENIISKLFFFMQILLPFTFILLRLTIKNICEDFIYPIWILEIIIKILIIVKGLLNFDEELIILTINLFMIFIFGETINKTEFILQYYIRVPFLIYLIYKITKKRKNNFINKKEKKKNYFESFLECINSGYIKIEKDKIVTINKAIIRELYEVESIREIINNNNNINEENLEEFIDNIKNNSTKIIEEILDDKIEDFMKNNSSSNNLKFVYLNTKSFNTNKNKKITYEIYYRIIQEDSHFIELIFNDVTKNKLIEEKLADEKYKSLINSKIAHEFKNPIISINELADQVLDFISKEPTTMRSSTNLSSNLKTRCQSSNFSQKSKKKKISKEILPQIKAMCSYLLIMIKDFAFFAKDHSHKIKLDNSIVSIEEILEVCNDIAKGILKKLGKSNVIKFKIKNNQNFNDKVLIDECKLKEILINLISNAIKFTNKGKIILEVKMINNENNSELLITINDTGIGMKEEQMDQGFGMQIIKELTRLIGTEIKFKSEIDVGSSFWFSIPYESEHFSNDEIILRSFNTPQSSIGKDSKINIFSDTDNESDKLIMENNDKYVIKKKYNKELKRMSLFNKQTEENIFMSDEDSINSAETIRISNYILAKPPTNRSEMNLFHNSFESSISHHENIFIDKDSDYIKYISSSSSFSLASIGNLSNQTINNIFKEKNSSIRTSNIHPTFNIIIADDEKFVRSALKRLLETTASQLNMNVNLLEAEDGVETIYSVYRCLTEGKRVTCILSDENMVYMRGSQSALIIANLTNDRRISSIPFYIVTTYEDTLTLKSIMNKDVTNVITKPMKRNNAEALLNNLKNSL